MIRPLNIEVLGDLRVEVDGAPATLPPSRKTRALLAYLAMTGKAHRREHLCEMFWDLPDDPRGALRWSLSKIRAIFGPENKQIMLADRDQVMLAVDASTTDLGRIRMPLAVDANSIDTKTLQSLVSMFRGELLEGLDLPNHPAFHSWCLAERSAARALHRKVLKALIQKLSASPDQAIDYARTLADIDPLDEGDRLVLIGLLNAAGRAEEAKACQQAGITFAKKFDVPVSEALLYVDHEARVSSVSADGDASVRTSDLGAPLLSAAFVGRDDILTELEDHLSRATGGARVVFLTGEPGIGKSRLIDEFAHRVRRLGGAILKGCGHESSWGRPYSPWLEALKMLSLAGTAPSGSRDLSNLMDRLETGRAEDRNRYSLFCDVVDALGAWISDNAQPVLFLDDIHWLDDASIDLFQHIVRSLRDRRLLILMVARDGDVPDNTSLMKLLRELRREGLLHERQLASLSSDAVVQLTHDISSTVDAAAVYAGSGGNPLLAIETARALAQGRVEDSRSLAELIRDRIGSLADEAKDFARWCSILGNGFGLDQVETLLPFDPDASTRAMEMLERHGILKPMGRLSDTQSYGFAHDIIRRTVYADMSEPRRRLMHRHVASVLQKRDGHSESRASEIAHHAALAGDAAMAVQACIDAGRLCLRLFANSEAATFARRGLHLANELRDPERIRFEIELTEISLSARLPENPHEMARELDSLASRALDHGESEHARLGYHLLSHLRWNNSEWSEARNQAVRAQTAGATGDAKSQVRSLAEMARCLAMLGRDLTEADAMLMEAAELARRSGQSTHVLPLATGLLNSLRGNWEAASSELHEARIQARLSGERIDEFQATEALVLLALRLNRPADARLLSRELSNIGERIREGSEAPLAHTLAALSDLRSGDGDAAARVRDALINLRVMDAKHRLTTTLSLFAETLMERDQLADAADIAAEAIDVSQKLGRADDEVQAHTIAARIAERRGDFSTFERHRMALTAERLAASSTLTQISAMALINDASIQMRTQALEDSPWN